MDVGQAITEGIRSTRDDDLFIVAHPWRGYIAWSHDQMVDRRAVLRWGRILQEKLAS